MLRNWKSRVLMSLAIAAALAAGFGTFGGDALAQSRLLIGGSQSNYGRGSLSAGFMPDPFNVNITSGATASNAVHVNGLGLGPSCRGFATAQPDYILDLNAGSFIRFYFTAQGRGDTTLVINDANGRWHCNDDSHGGLNPTVDINNPPSGQYDIWVGSYRAGTNISGQLHVTELRSNHP